jgi:hypothetical protein
VSMHVFDSVCLGGRGRVCVSRGESVRMRRDPVCVRGNRECVKETGEKQTETWLTSPTNPPNSATGGCLMSPDCESGACRLTLLGGRWMCCQCGGRGNGETWCEYCSIAFCPRPQSIHSLLISLSFLEPFQGASDRQG